MQYISVRRKLIKNMRKYCIKVNKNTKFDLLGCLIQCLKYHLTWHQGHFLVLTTFLVCIFLQSWCIAANIGSIQGHGV